jgi:hypothetical protein
MNRYTRDTGAYKASINNAAIELFLKYMEEYKINFRYFITIEFIPGKATSSLIDGQIKHLDNVNKALFGRNKRNVDTPGLIYIKERYNHNRSEFHLHVFLEEVPDAILQKHIDETFLVSSKSGIMEMVKEDWGMKMLAATSDYTRTRTFYLIQNSTVIR